MQSLEPSMKNIDAVPLNKYARNLMISPMCDISILPSGGGSFDKRGKIDGENLDQGKFEVVDFQYQINQRHNMRNALGINMSLNDNKLPINVAVPNLTVITQQVVKNIVDPNHLTLYDLTEEDRTNVLGTEQLTQSIEEASPMYREIKTLQKDGSQPVPIDINSPAFRNLAAVIRNIPVSQNTIDSSMKIRKLRNAIKVMQ